MTRASGLGRTWTYATAMLPSGGQQLMLTGPDSTTSELTREPNGNQVLTQADGTITRTVMGLDPRFGLEAPVPASVTVTTPGGLFFDRATSRTAVFGSTQDLATLASQTETTVVNGRSYQTIFDAGTGTFTTTTPAERTSTSTIDAQGRVTRTQVRSLTPVDFI